MSIAGKWGFSHDGERYTLGGDSREAAIREAEALGYRRFWVGQFKEPITDEAFDAQFVLEQITTQDDYCGDWAEEAFWCTRKQELELTAELRRVFREWMERHQLRPQFGVVEDAEEIVSAGVLP